MATTKRCRKCGVEKPLDQFYRHARTKDGRDSYCKPCKISYHAVWAKANPERRRASNRKATWKQRGIDITEEQYQLLLKVQGGRCYWCRNRPGSKRRLPVDHDHETGEVRALTCGVCNHRFLGNAERNWRKGEPVLPCLVEYFTNPPARAILRGTAA